MASRDFWKVWTASTVSNVGDGVVLVAIPLMAADLTRDPLAVAAATVAVRLPWVVFGPVAGALVDRSDRRRMMVLTDAARSLLLAAMAVLVALDAMTLPALYLLVFAAGILETLFDGAAMSIVPAVVPVGELERANGHLFAAQIAANSFAGPALGGAMFAVAVWLPFGFDSATFLASVLILLTLRGRFRPAQAARRSLWTEVGDGLRFVWREKIIRTFAIGAGLLNFGFTAAASVLVLHAQDNLGLGDAGYGLLLAGAAVGGMAGAQLAGRVIAAVGRYRSVVATIAVMAAALVVIGVAPRPLVAGAAFALLAFFEEVWNVVSVTYRQARTPEGMLGRVMNGFRVIAYGTFPLGAVAGGAVAGVFGLRATFLFGAAAMLALLPLVVSTMSESRLAPR